MANIYNHWTMTFSGTQSFGVWFYYWNAADCSSYSGFRDAAVGTHTSPYVLDLGGWPEGAYPAISVEQRTDAPSTTLTIHHKIEVGPSPTGPWSLCAEFDLTSVAGSATQWSACYPYHAAAPPPPPCQYGTRRRADKPLVAVIDSLLLQAALTLIPGEWLGMLLNIWIGSTVDVQVLCASPPHDVPTIVTDMLINPGRGTFEILRRVLWDEMCECAPGPTTPTPYPPYNPTMPPGWPTSPTYPVNPTNPCLDLTEVRRKLDELLRITGQDYTVDVLNQRYSLPFATVNGAVHSGLSGEGSFAIAVLVGVQIVITGHPLGRELEGVPHYIWDLGWISCMDGNGFIQERRITRLNEVWMPRGFQEATILGYSFKTGVTARITELEAEG